MVTQDILDALKEFEERVSTRLLESVEVAVLTPDMVFRASENDRFFAPQSSVLYAYTGRLGDTLVHTSALHQLRKNCPNRVYHLCTRLYTASLWLNNGDINGASVS